MAIACSSASRSSVDGTGSKVEALAAPASGSETWRLFGLRGANASDTGQCDKSMWRARLAPESYACSETRRRTPPVSNLPRPTCWRTGGDRSGRCAARRLRKRLHKRLRRHCKTFVSALAHLPSFSCSPSVQYVRVVIRLGAFPINFFSLCLRPFWTREATANFHNARVLIRFRPASPSQACRLTAARLANGSAGRQQRGRQRVNNVAKRRAHAALTKRRKLRIIEV